MKTIYGTKTERFNARKQNTIKNKSMKIKSNLA